MARESLKIGAGRDQTVEDDLHTDQIQFGMKFPEARQSYWGDSRLRQEAARDRIHRLMTTLLVLADREEYRLFVNLIVQQADDPNRMFVRSESEFWRTALFIERQVFGDENPGNPVNPAELNLTDLRKKFGFDDGIVVHN